MTRGRRQRSQWSEENSINLKTATDFRHYDFETGIIFVQNSIKICQVV